MDKKFDYSEFELGKLTYNFSNLSEKEADEKRSLYEQFLREKEEAKAAQIAAKAATAASSEPSSVPANTAPKRPVFRPTAKPTPTTPPPAEPANSEGSAIEHPLTDATPTEMERIAQGGLETTKHPTFKPTQKPVKPVDVESREAEQTENTPPIEKPAIPKPAFRPSMRPGQAPKPAEPETTAKADTPSEPVVPNPNPKPTVFRPTMKPPVKELDASNEVEPPKPKPAGFRPTMKPASVPTKVKDETPEPEPKAQIDSIPENPENKEPELPKPKPAFRPTMKPKPKSDDGQSA